MGVIKRGILGGFSNSVANVVGTSWKGIAVIKSKPLSVANPKTAGQVAQRTKFSGIVGIASALVGSLLQIVWNSFASGMSGYNLFVQMNVKTAFNDAGEFQFDGVNISPSTGTDSIAFTTTLHDGQTGCNVSYNGATVVPNGQPTDIPMLVAIDSNGIVIGASAVGGARQNNNFAMGFNREVTLGEQINLYLAFYSADKKRAFAQAILSTEVIA